MLGFSTESVAIAVALWVAFANGFARPLSPFRRIVQWFCYLLIVSAIVITAAQVIGMQTLWFNPVPLSLAPAWALPMDAATLAAVLCSVLSISATHGVDRQRAAWSLVPMSLLLGCLQVFVFVTVVAPYAIFVAMAYVYSIVTFLAPLALTYAALNRRLIDIGFVLNRTVVFGLVSTIVFGAFVLVEWAASEWLVNASHPTSVIVGMAVALALGLSLRYIHKYVDRFVDHVFFRKRHDDEAALRRFAHECSYITDASVLLERAARTVADHTAGEATIVIRDGAAGYVSASNGKRFSVDENDSGIVSLRAWNKPVDLHSLQDSALRGEFAFPMTSRGTLVGALICGAKRDEEAYAPDETAALAALAHGVGSALEALSSGDDGALESLRETQSMILRELRALPGKLGAP